MARGNESFVTLPPVRVLEPGASTGAIQSCSRLFGNAVSKKQASGSKLYCGWPILQSRATAGLEGGPLSP